MQESQNTESFIKKPTFWLTILVFAAFNILAYNSSFTLWDEDESAYAGIALTMSKTGDYLNQDFLFSEIHKKPPLHFWLMVTTYKLFGINEWSVRFWSSIGTLGSLLLLCFYLPKRIPKEVGFLAAAILSSNFLVIALGKVGVIDGLLLFFELAALLALWKIIQDESKKHAIVFWAAISLGILLKGPPIALLTGLVCLIILVAHPNRSRIWRLMPWFGLPIALTPLCIWGYFSWQQDGGELVRQLIDWYILQRIGLGSSDEVQQTWSQPFGFHLAILMIACMPWWGFLGTTIKQSILSIKKKSPNAIFFIAWLIAAWLFYEFFSSKLPAYTIAAHPALAIAISYSVFKWYKRESDDDILVTVGTILKALFAFFFATSFILTGSLAAEEAGMSAAVTASMPYWIMAFAGAVAVFADKRGATIWIYSLLGPVLIALLLLAVVNPIIQPSRELPKEIADTIATEYPDKSIVLGLAGPTALPSIPFYLKKNGMENIIRESNKNTLIELYEAKTNTILVLDEKHFSALQASSVLDSLALTKIDTISGVSLDRLQRNNMYIIDPRR